MKRFLLFLISTSLFQWTWFTMRPEAAFAQTPVASGPTTLLSEKQWQAVFSQFEKSVWELYQSLEKTRTEIKGLQADIQNIEGQIAAIRKKSGDNPGVFEEIRLKGLLNDLKPKLEQNSLLERQWHEKQRDFEQKTLSLLSLYNDKIETELKTGGSPTSLDEKIRHLQILTQKRDKLQNLLDLYSKPGRMEKAPSFPDLKKLPADKESLPMALHLLENRKKELEDEFAKLSLQEEEIKNELRLQEKMKDFLEDIQHMNEDSDFPHGSLKRSDIDNITAKNQKGQLEARLAEIKKKQIKADKNYQHVNDLIAEINGRMEKLGGPKGRTP